MDRCIETQVHFPLRKACAILALGVLLTTTFVETGYAKSKSARKSKSKISRSKTTTKKQEIVEVSPGVYSGNGVVLKAEGIDPAYAKALAVVLQTSRNIYVNDLKCPLPSIIEMDAKLDSTQKTSLWTDGEKNIFLTVNSMFNLAPPSQGGACNIYGISHEIGHIIMYQGANPLGLPPGVGQGWAHYMGSLVTDLVYKKLGPNVWPVPYDYTAEGMKRLTSQVENLNSDSDPETRVAAAFYKADHRYGSQKVFSAMNKATATKPFGKDLMPLFVKEFVKITGNEDAGVFFTEEMMVPKVDWKVASREINDETTEGLISTPEGDGVLLKYDNDKSDGMLSTGGSGYAVVLKRPAGDWGVDSVQIFGSRYGETEAPAEDFSIYVCDQDFNVIQEIKQPYSKLERGDAKWYTFDFAPVRVPEGFYICLNFNATATKGFYMNYSNVRSSHSKYALPWVLIRDLKENRDWMIRTHLKKLGG